MARPALHVIAGPNGAGKTSLYEKQLRRRFPDAEFVNADRLALERYGHPAQTLAESQTGQDMAEARRRELMAERKSLVTETTFSHPSKLDLLRDARALGYELRVYHVNVRSVEVSVNRVAQRVVVGGHPVPEDRIRERYERNQPLIREAVRMADRAVVFDNSTRGGTHQLALEYRQGEVVRLGANVPTWARELYADDLQRFTPERVNAPAASFAAAQAVVKRLLGDSARTYITRSGTNYRGPVIGETPLHVVQRLAERAAVAHFKTRLERVPLVGEEVAIAYPAQHGAKARVQDARAPAPDVDTRSRLDKLMARLAHAADQVPVGQGGALESSLRELRQNRDPQLRESLAKTPETWRYLEKALDKAIPQQAVVRGRGLSR